ncbi:MAG: putative NRPS-like protein biosynthetic cluster [Sclerophora amabilis]|nr:MAG: putative NRPS-like protein biosynthetic cluster [Sclerophora amabilis]
MKQTAANLYHMLKIAASETDAGITIYPPGGALKPGRRISYHELFQRAHAKAHLIHHINGISKDSIVFLHFDQHTDSIEWFWAVIVAGYVPAISTPFVNDHEQRRKHLVHVNSVLRKPVILTTQNLVPEFLDVDQLNIQPIEAFQEPNGSEPTRDDGSTKQDDDLAVLMLTSGSSGSAKAVCLRHGQIVKAVQGKSTYHGTDSGDTFLNWIGMDHVANLTEVHLHAMNLGAEQVHAQAADLLLEPLQFLTLIDKHRVAYTFAPNFFLASLKRALEVSSSAPGKAVQFNLSCIKTIISGGEANVTETCVELTSQLHQHNVKQDIIRPGFGMTETCAGSIYGKSCPTYDVTHNLEFSSLGTCIPGMKMRVMTDVNKTAVTGEVGDLQTTGPICFKNYFNNPSATAEAFTDDGWFITGDRAFIDSNGNLNLAGRAKETIIMNGVKYIPLEVETALEEALIPGMTPSYTAVFPHRPKGSQTEGFCVVYLPSFHEEDVKTRAETADSISKVCGMICSARPFQILPLNSTLLPKSSLGKLSRAKLRAAFENGSYRGIQEKSNTAIKEYRALKREKPANEVEELILVVFADMFELPQEEIGVDSSLFDLGVSSIELIAFKQRVQDKLSLEDEIPLITVLTNPSIRGMAAALDTMKTPQPYNPVVPLQTKGQKTPLWLVHPGVGEVLVFLNLGKYITDRPVYALRARGFNEGEKYFEDIPDAVNTYYEHIKSVQPQGPYAIAGYSFGAMLAFEVSKRLEANGDEIGFLGSFNLPPHIKARMHQLDWIEVVLNLAYFLDLMSEEYAHEISPSMHQCSHDEVLDFIMKGAPPGRLEELTMTKPKLATWASLAHAMQYAAREYDPSGSVAHMDIFFAIPLSAVAKSKEDWVVNYLSKWKDFTRSDPRFHEVDGAHYTMMGPEHIFSFQKKLKSVLRERGL